MSSSEYTRIICYRPGKCSCIVRIMISSSRSPVFRETLRSGTGWEEDADSLPRIHLADKRIESSTVLTAALDCIYGGVDVKLPSSVSSNIDIIAFLRRYECQGTLDRVRFVLHRWAVEATASDWFRAFLVSAATHDLDICRQAIRHGGSVMLEAWSPVVPEDATPRQKSEAQRNARLAADTCLDLGAMPLWMYKILPPEFAWAMQRVMRGRRMINTQAEWDLIGSEVVELLRNYGERGVALAHPHLEHC